jgi:hypothetical protein
MALLDELRNASDAKFKEMLDQFVTNLIPEIKESAEQGYSGCRVRLNDPGESRVPLFQHPRFLSELQKDENLKGLEISIEKKIHRSGPSTQMSRPERYLYINWTTE